MLTHCEVEVDQDEVGADPFFSPTGHNMAAMTGVASPAVALLTGLPSPPRTCTDVTLKMCIPAPVERERMRNRSKVDPPQ